MTEKEIVEMFLNRDESALAAARSAYGAYCIRLARNITGDPRDAEECVADALNAAWEHIPPEEPEHFGAYLAKLTRNRALEVRKSVLAQKRGGGAFPLPLDEAALSAASPGPEEELFKKELTDAINSFLATRPQYQRVIFTLRYFACERVVDIAKKLNRSPASVTAVLRRLKKGLEKYLKERGFDI